MSSNDEDYGPEFDQSEIQMRRTQRPCDVCRRRKTRCQGSQSPGDKCLTCLSTNLDCTYLDSARKRLTKSRYVVDLETRLSDSEALVRQLCNEITKLRADLTMERSKNSSDDTNHTTNPRTDERDASLQILRKALRSISAPPPAPHEEDLLDAEIERKMDKFSMNTTRRFIGKSSGAALLKAVIELKADIRHKERAGEVRDEDPDAADSWASRRPEYWMLRFKPWENITRPKQAYSFPPPDLTAQLIDLYFTRAHVYLPLLHRQTFDRGVTMGVHNWDNSFAAIVLLVCAIGSRWSDDPRVMAGTARLQCGWEWFNQVPPDRKHLFGQGTLYDLQYYCLVVHFLLGSSAHQAGWMLLGVGIRLAQDAGAHRRTSRVEQPTVEREQWKRAFWVLVYFDSYVSSLLGRSCVIQYDDFDIDPPIECDDEYWEHPTHPFVQPPGVPSRIAFFNALLCLSHILGLTLKILYSLNKARATSPVDDGWEEHFVADLDSALNRWRDQVPEHLAWDPARADPVFFDQSVALHCAYYQLQILIHRSLLPTVRKPSSIALPSLAVCSSAARACANMLDIQRRRKGTEPVNFNMSGAFSAGLVLLINVWSGKLTPEPTRDLASVHKCMEVLRLCEDRWPNAGILWDILSELASVRRLPIQRRSDPPYGNEYYGQQQPNRVMVGNAGNMSQATSAEDTPSSSMLANAPSMQHTYEAPLHLLPHEYSNVAGAGLEPVKNMPIDPNAFQSNTWLTPEEVVSQLDPAASSQAGPEMDDDVTGLIDTEMISMWMNAPMGFEADDWGRYLTNFGQ
ncbi:fungal-specific transcription factor domain-containing protein [Mycena vulgaris]|nr:fungal-specific transcription factor domain-containing protein [Mycena vulgaris]